MNIEELELSLRSEYEGQLKQALAEVRREAADFEKRFEAEFEKQKAEMLRLLNDFVARIPESYGLDRAFEESISEHLRLARDEGAQIAATAFGEAEKLKADAVAPARYDALRDSIADISSKDTQAGILSALVEHSAEFAPRGAFFIVKNDRFIGWRTFGAPGSEEVIREIDFPVNSDSILAMAVRSLATARANAADYGDQVNFLSRLNFGTPATMVAIPLIARGRGVAVLYVDSGDTSIQPNIEALEALVRVAGLTVELIAAMQTAIPSPAAYAQPSTPGQYAVSDAAAAPQSEPQPQSHPEIHTEPQPSAAADAFSQSETVNATPVAEDEKVSYYEPIEHSVEAEEVPAPATGKVYDASLPYDVPFGQPEAGNLSANEPTVETTSSFEYTEYTGSVTLDDGASHASQAESAADSLPTQEVYEIEYNEPVTESFPTTPSAGSTREFEFGSSEVAGQQQAEASQFTDPDLSRNYDEPQAKTNGSSKPGVAEPQPAVEAPEPAVARPRVSRLSDRNVDLPIEVADTERRFHNDARRFARLLVSEIKLYNEQKVAEGRQNGDLYDRLREAIDRSREMYDKRVEPVVAAKFDYFHYELVNSLAEGDVSKLGASYPGPTI